MEHLGISSGQIWKAMVQTRQEKCGMRTITKARLWIAVAITFLFVASTNGQAQADVASHVDPFIGTSTNWIQDVANTLPGATVPFGMLYWSPDRVDGNFYKFEGTTTRGFSLTHLSGPGCSVFGDVPILPILGSVEVPPPQQPEVYQASYKPEEQTAQPGYYAVQLASGIDVQLAAAARSGIAKLDFPRNNELRTVIIDLSRNLTRVDGTEIRVQGKTVSGSVESGEFCGAENHYRLYFSLRVDQEPESEGTFDELKVRAGSGSEGGLRAGGYLTFSSKVKTLEVKVGISYVSVENAALNMEREIPGWDFAATKNAARAAWNDALGHIEVQGGTETQQKIFYTALYHSLLHPSVFSDVNGEYLGFDGRVHRAGKRVQYANFSGWDIYRCQVQLTATLFPGIASDMAQSLVADAEQGGGLPIWPVANDESGVMVGDPSDLILANVYAFGAQEFDTRAALKAMLKGADDPAIHARLYTERPGLPSYLKSGYVAQREGVSSSAGAAAVTLENANADFAIAKFAEALGESDIARRFLLRSANWRSIFDPETKYIRARDDKGHFLPDFSPAKTDGFVEGNAAQYTWMVPYDLAGIIESVGGPEAASGRLDDYFSEYGRWTGSGYTAHFFISNEPSFGDPWIYNWTGNAWRTQEVVRKALGDLFLDSPGGIPGNDDLGATSAWAVWGFLGVYPEIPGVAGWTLNTPTFPKATLHLGEGVLEIRAEGGPAKAYIEGVTLDGKPISNFWVERKQLRAVSHLDFALSEIASNSIRGVPPSFPPPPVK